MNSSTTDEKNRFLYSGNNCSFHPSLIQNSFKTPELLRWRARSMWHHRFHHVVLLLALILGESLLIG